METEVRIYERLPENFAATLKSILEDSDVTQDGDGRFYHIDTPTKSELDEAMDVLCEALQLETPFEIGKISVGLVSYIKFKDTDVAFLALGSGYLSMNNAKYPFSDRDMIRVHNAKADLDFYSDAGAIYLIGFHVPDGSSGLPDGPRYR